VRHDVPGGFHSVVRNYQAKVDAKIRNDYDRYRKQESESCGSCGFAL